MPPPRWIRRLIELVFVAGCAAALPRLWYGQQAEGLARDPASVEALARGVIESVDRVDSGASRTGSPRFDGEWRMITQQMTALGLGQLALEHPERRAEYLPVIERCVQRLQGVGVTDFGLEAWGRGGLDDLASDRGHAYLGYVNLAFGMLRLLDAHSSIGPLHDRVSAALARRLANAPHGVIETYPGETYPADVSAVAASLALHDRVARPLYAELLAHWSRVFFDRYADPRSGLLYQVVDAASGTPLGPPRASGTAIAVYFLSFVDGDGARRLSGAVARQHASFLGFGGVREYPPGVGGSGDVDSGPLFFGVSASASAFALAGARLYGHDAQLTELLSTAALVGVPVEMGGRLSFASGGGVGNAIVLAALTARRRPA